MDFRPLANKLNAWIKGEGQTILHQKFAGSEPVELLSFRDGGYRCTYLLTKDGIAQQFYPVTQPQRKEESTTTLSDSLHFIEAMYEEGDHHTPEDIEKFFWEKAGVV